MSCEFQVEVVAGIYVWSVNDEGAPGITCGMLEDEGNNLRLPSSLLTYDQHAAHIAIALFRKYIAIDPRTLDIVPYGFFDPVRPQLDNVQMQQRTVYSFYKTKIHPGTPIHPDLRFMTYEEIEIARPRIARGHYEAYRTGISG